MSDHKQGSEDSNRVDFWHVTGNHCTCNQCNQPRQLLPHIRPARKDSCRSIEHYLHGVGLRDTSGQWQRHLTRWTLHGHHHWVQTWGCRKRPRLSGSQQSKIHLGGVAIARWRTAENGKIQLIWKLLKKLNLHCFAVCPHIKNKIIKITLDKLPNQLLTTKSCITQTSLQVN